MASDEGCTAAKNQNDQDTEQSHIMRLESKFTHRVGGQFWFRGTMYNRDVCQEVLEALPQMQSRAGDCLLVGYPKSGTTWLQEVVWLLRNNLDINRCNQVPTYIRNPFLEGPITQMVDACPSPRTLKTHIRPTFAPHLVANKEIKIIHILRNPKDVAVSYFHFYQSFSGLGNFSGSWAEFLDMFLEGFVLCGNWFDFVAEWWSTFKQANVCVVMYEDLKLRPKETIMKLATFFEKSLEDKDIQAIMEQTSFDNMRANPMTNFEEVTEINKDVSPFIRKGCVGNWQQYFTTEQSQLVDQTVKEKLGHTDLLFTYNG